MDIEALLAPVSAAAPCGENLAFSPELDAIARARQADDPSIEQGAWVTTLKEADWKFVAAGCTRLLTTRSKDLRLAGWLAEALAKTAGLRALGEALHLAAGLCERYWDGVYPLPDEDGHEQRIGNLCWLAARVAQLVRELPVTGGTPAYSLDQFVFARAQAGKADGGGEDAGGAGGAAAPLDAATLETARRRTPAGFYDRLREDVGYCQHALLTLEKVIDARLGADGPGFSAARAGLQDLLHFAGPTAQGAALPEPADQAEAGAVADGAAGVAVVRTVGEAYGTADGTAFGTPTTSTPVVAAAMPVPAAIAAAPSYGPVQSRAQALAQLRAVASFFRQTEPHSPVAYLADKAAHWGEQPLHVLLRAVIKDDVQYAQLAEMLGATGQT